MRRGAAEHARQPRPLSRLVDSTTHIARDGVDGRRTRGTGRGKVGTATRVMLAGAVAFCLEGCWAGAGPNHPNRASASFSGCPPTAIAARMGWSGRTGLLPKMAFAPATGLIEKSGAAPQRAALSCGQTPGVFQGLNGFNKKGLWKPVGARARLAPLRVAVRTHPFA